MSPFAFAFVTAFGDSESLLKSEGVQLNSDVVFFCFVFN